MDLRESLSGRAAARLAVLAIALALPVTLRADEAGVAIDTAGLNPIGDWVKENPYRPDKAQYDLAIKIGQSGYNQNCARCHGLEVKSGGIAPDLRFLDDGKAGDEWFINRARTGFALNGLTKMPRWEGVISQEAMWAIRSYIETRPKD